MNSVTKIDEKLVAQNPGKIKRKLAGLFKMRRHRLLTEGIILFKTLDFITTQMSVGLSRTISETENSTLIQTVYETNTLFLYCGNTWIGNIITFMIALVVTLGLLQLRSFAKNLKVARIWIDLILCFILLLLICAVMNNLSILMGFWR